MNSQFRILLLGGAGKAGQAIVGQLLRSDRLQLTITSRRREHCAKVARRFGWDGSDRKQRVVPRTVDAAHGDSLDNALADCDLVVVCMPYNSLARTVLEAVMRADCDYIDINTDRGKHEVFAELEQTVLNNRRTFITEAGLIPGYPLVLAKKVLSELPAGDSVTIASLYRDPSLAVGSARDILSELRKRHQVLRNGHWRNTSAMNYGWVNFNGRFGKRLTAPVDLPELHALARQHSLDHLELRQAGTNAVVNLLAIIWTILPQCMANRAEKITARSFQLACRWFTRRPHGVVLTVSAYVSDQRETQSISLRIENNNVYEATAIPVAEAVKLMRNRRCPTGIHFLGDAVPIDEFLSGLVERGMMVDE